MKYVTLHQLIESVPCNSNYTFTSAPDSESREYDDNMWNDIVSNLIDHCDGRFDLVAKSYINLFDSEDNYLESYTLELTEDERKELEEDCNAWLADAL